MSGELQRFLGKFTIGTDRKDFTVDGNPVALTAGDYYPWGITGETQFLEHIQVKIRALGGIYTGALVSASNTTGKVTIDLQVVGTSDIVWTDAALGTLLGYPGNLTGASAYIAPQQMRYCWFPSVGFAEYPGHLTDFFAPHSTTVGYRSPGGQTYARKGNLLYDGTYTYKFLTAAEVWQSGSAWWASFESFFEDVIHEGMPCRVFPDRSLNTAVGNYKECMYAPDEGESIGSLRNLTNRVLTRYNGYWELSMKLWKYIS